MAIEAADLIGLVKTKYRVPGLNKQLLPRRMANHMLEDSLSHKLTLITAPAGYGKSTAVLKWLEQSQLPSAWLSLDTGDNDALVFWRYFCAALESISKGISKDTEYVFASPELFKANMHLCILIDSLSSIVSDFLLILDDLHLITNPAVYDGLSYFLNYMPANMHLVLIGRVTPRLNLERLGLKEDLIRIGPSELRFETEEISQYYKMRGFSLQNEEIKKIESYTEGWAAALVAVAQSLKNERYRHNIISSFGSCNQHIENYLAEDVFNTWTGEHQDFMEKTAILDMLCGSLCQAVTDYDGNRLLKELYGQNSFLIALDDEGIWFRYHHLFSDFLRKRLKRKKSASIQCLHHKAGAWLRANGFFNEATEHFLKGNYYEEAVALIEVHGRSLVRQGEYFKVISWIEQLPDKYVQNSAVIMLLKTVY
jgi:LuxR family maltose regulon positive regulatory protein